MTAMKIIKRLLLVTAVISFYVKTTYEQKSSYTNEQALDQKYPYKKELPDSFQLKDMDNLKAIGNWGMHDVGEEETEVLENMTKMINCGLTVSKRSAKNFEYQLSIYNPYFARLLINFGHINVSYKPGVIKPNHYIWTFSSLKSLFLYLKWPIDFSVLSFGLLDAKTQTDYVYLNINSKKNNCSMTIGDFYSTIMVGQALKNMTKTYLVPLRKDYTFSYYCFLAEVPNVKNTLEYQLGIYIDFPVQFARYNCCRTYTYKYNNSVHHVHCLNRQIKQLYLVSVIPYIMALITFAYFPSLLISVNATLTETDERRKWRHSYESLGEDSYNWVFLDGSSPICITKMIGGLCGLVDYFPVAVSRARRMVFLLIAPIVIYIELVVYTKYKHVRDVTLALLDHGAPLGYLSMIGGYEKSKSNFVPFLGGPYILLLTFYIAGTLFVILPECLDSLIHEGCNDILGSENASPLLYNIKSLEKLSTLSISDKFGYRRGAVIIKARIYMLMNYRFWTDSFKIQWQRLRTICMCITAPSQKLFIFILLILSPVYIALCLAELVVCILYNGMPLLNVMVIVVRGYILAQSNFFGINGPQPNTCREIASFCIRILCSFITTCLFVCFAFSIFTIFIASFSFLAEVVVMSFIAVIVYPSLSFGYLFFGIVLVYYIQKLFQNFGSEYLTLLADAVEISLCMKSELFYAQIINGSIYIGNTRGMHINKIQIKDHIINLSTDQRLQVQNMQAEESTKVLFRNHVAGIPRKLFSRLVREYRPIHIQLTKAMLKLSLIVALIAITFSIVLARPLGESEGISEVMHVIFIVAIGALPRLLEAALDNNNDAVAKEIEIKKIKTSIIEYWSDINDGPTNNQGEEEDEITNEASIQNDV